MGKAPTHCSPGCFDRKGRECGAWRPEGSASGHQGLPDSRLPSRQEGWSLVPFCSAQLLGHPQAMLYPFWALVGDGVQEALSVCWLGEGIPEEYAQDLGLPGLSLYHSVYHYTPSTAQRTTHPQKCRVHSVPGLTHSHYQTNTMPIILDCLH